jgi:hypothetical protein
MSMLDSNQSSLEKPQGESLATSVGPMVDMSNAADVRNVFKCAEPAGHASELASGQLTFDNVFGEKLGSDAGAANPQQDHVDLQQQVHALVQDVELSVRQLSHQWVGVLK